MTSRLRIRARTLVAALLFALPAPAAVQAQAAPRADSASAAALFPPAYPRYSLGRDLTILGFGGGLLASTALVSADIRTVPAQGLDASQLAWSLDRGVVGTFSARADLLSDRTRDAAAAYPFLLAWVSNPGARWSAVGRRSLVYAEAFMLTGGLTYVSKRMIGRARPFTYLTAAELAGHSGYDVTQSSAFESMPSGHAASAFAGAGLAITEHLLTRPGASGLERFGVAVLGGALGGATSTLRVEAGKHFPSDVLVGAGIGLTAGVALPLLHRGERPWPSRRHWLEAAGGVLTGALVGALVVDVAY